ncbi:MAG: hypothetical protein CMN30_23070 [Sandaracinus sp.]|nr:hypothetical protein [Sandaracinus sp.]|tara:strand:+ start:125 stop:1255 length:1131 start_codon:yes stop_codon:yes gene_type:complete
MRGSDGRSSARAAEPGRAGRCSVFDEFDDPLGGGLAVDLAPVPIPAPRKESPKKPVIDVFARGRSLAALPEPPDGALGAPAYARAASRRLRELRRLYAEATARHRSASQRARELRTNLGMAIHRQGSPELGSLVAAVDGAASTAEEREAQLEAMRAEAAQERARQAAALGELRRELEPWQSRLGRARAEVDIAQRDYDAARAALARVEAEMQPLGGDPAALAPFKATYDDRRAALTDQRQRLERHRATLAEAQTSVERLEARMVALETERERVDRTLRDAEAAAQAAASSAGADRGEALRHLARAALERGLVPDDLAGAEAAIRATEAEAEATLDVNVHVAALRVADDESLRRGATLVAALVAGLVAVVFAAATVL